MEFSQFIPAEKLICSLKALLLKGLILQTLPTVHIVFMLHHSSKLYTSIDFGECRGEYWGKKERQIHWTSEPCLCLPKAIDSKEIGPEWMCLTYPKYFTCPPTWLSLPFLHSFIPFQLFSISHTIFSMSFFFSLVPPFQNVRLFPSWSSFFWEISVLTHFPHYHA